MKNLLKDYKNHYLYIQAGNVEFNIEHRASIISEDNIFIEITYDSEDDDGNEIIQKGLIAKATINQICKLESVKKANKKSEADF